MVDAPIRISKTPVVIVKNLIFTEFVVTIVYQIAAYMADYGQLYQGFQFAHAFPYEVAKLMLKLSVEGWIIGYILARWYFHRTYLYPDRVVVRSGVLFRGRTVVPLVVPVTVSYAFGFLSRMFSYGTLVVTGGDGASVRIREVPNVRAVGSLFESRLASFASSRASLVFTQNITELISSRESERLEFKSSLRWDRQLQKVNRAMEKAVVKTVAAFLNSGGGVLVIGVDDGGRVVGLQPDYASLPKPSADGFENHFNNVFRDAVGAEFRHHVHLRFHVMEGVELCSVHVGSAHKPVYVNMDNAEAFYIRTGNATTPLKLSEVASYTKSRWG